MNSVTSLPPRALEIIRALYATFIDLANGSDDDRRVLTRTIAEQIRFELGPEWGCKASTPTNPQGQSQIAFNAPDGLVGWRWQDNDGSVTGVPNGPLPNPPMQSFAGQHFIAVAPINHFAAGPGPAPEPGAPPAPPLPPAPPTDDEIERLITIGEHVVDAIEELVATIAALDQRLTELQQRGVRLRL
jgi:hypothetical protein